MNDATLTSESLRVLLLACDHFMFALSTPRSAYGKQQAARGAELLDWLIDVLPRSSRLVAAQKSLSFFKHAPSKATLAELARECDRLYVWCKGYEAAQRRFAP